jgi:tetratricopeptide (TPR) repeat protein
MLVVVIAGVIIARTYYGNINRAVDPRITHARELYGQYDALARLGNFYEIFELLDSIERIYDATEHYRQSYETGVIENNRAAALLTIALYGDSIVAEKNPLAGYDSDSIVMLAKTHALKAITIYETWGREFEGMNEKEISSRIEAGFKVGFRDLDPDQVNRFLKNRVREIEAALNENSRRLSVCHTNLGVIYRHQENYVDAVKQYDIALTLWDRNLDAENNLNKLLNKPLKKRNLIQKLFPPEREEREE